MLLLIVRLFWQLSPETTDVAGNPAALSSQVDRLGIWSYRSRLNREGQQEEQREEQKKTKEGLDLLVPCRGRRKADVRHLQVCHVPFERVAEDRSRVRYER